MLMIVIVTEIQRKSMFWCWVLNCWTMTTKNDIWL